MLRCEALSVFAQHGIFCYRFAFIGTENQADCRIVFLDFESILEQADVSIHLPDIGMRQLANL
jgi:hypothetical protein